MFQNFNYAYVIGNFVVGFPVWLFLFIYRKDLRKEMLIASCCIALIAPLWELWFLKDYWHPESLNTWRIVIGDVTYGFFSGGIANVIYEELFGKYFSKRRTYEHHWRWLLLPFAVLGFLVFNLLVTLGLYSIYAALITFLALTIFMISLRKDLFFDGLVSGFSMGILTLGGYMIFLTLFPGIIHEWWYLVNTSGALILGIPVEELLWAFGLGMVCGPFYEFFAGLRFKKS